MNILHQVHKDLSLRVRLRVRLRRVHKAEIKTCIYQIL